MVSYLRACELHGAGGHQLALLHDRPSVEGEIGVLKPSHPNQPDELLTQGAARELGVEQCVAGRLEPPGDKRGLSAQ